MKKVILLSILSLILIIVITGCKKATDISIPDSSESATTVQAKESQLDETELTSTLIQNGTSVEAHENKNDSTENVSYRQSTEKNPSGYTATTKSAGPADNNPNSTTTALDKTNRTTTENKTTTKKHTTTSTTTQKNKLTRSDIDCVQAKAHAYIQSKGMSINSSVSSFSFRTSSYNYTNRDKLLSKVKEAIDFEYQECINSGWNKVDMYVQVNKDDAGDYWLIVMYG